ncbi:MAG TPA: tetratricopeptide repeat protein [Candidatus Dormibacteraeota bacterium]|nr:tetratricopeptide repeat protein [Candidatus Dormibacteraeota bacterium]
MRGTSIVSLLTALFLLTAVSLASSPQDLLASGHVDEAVAALEQQVRQAPNDAAGYNLLCRAYFMMEEWDRGIANCERARNLDPQNSVHYLWLGRIYGEKADRAGLLSAGGLGKKSRTAFERAVELDPRNWEARKDLAEFYFSAPGIVGGGKDKARDQAEAIRALNPAAADWVVGQIAEKNRDYPAAEREYRAAIAASKSGVWAWVELAIFFRHINRLDDMEKALLEAETAPVDHHEALMDGASLLMRTGRDPALGIRLLRRYFSVGPVEEGPAYKAHEYWGQLLERQGDHHGAAAEYRAALALFHGFHRAEEDLKRVER